MYTLEAYKDIDLLEKSVWTVTIDEHSLGGWICFGIWPRDGNYEGASSTSIPGIDKLIYSPNRYHF